MEVTISGGNWIGNSLSKTAQETFRAFDPKNNQATEWIFHKATDAEIENALALAQEAFTAYQAVTGKERAAFLRTIADEIAALGETLIATYCTESGLPEGRARGERGRTMAQLRLFADMVAEGSWVNAVIEYGDSNAEPMPKADIRKMSMPLGPVVVFGASNFPLAFSTAGGDTASALAAGCPVIVKAHPMHPATGDLVAQAILSAADKCGMPNGVFSNLNSDAIALGKQLVMDPRVTAVGFTGSVGGGTALYRMAAERAEPIPVFAEMGSINPVLALPSALGMQAGEWAQKYAASITMGAGQFCTNPGVVIGLAGADLEGFIHLLAKALDEVSPSCMLHPDIAERYQHGKAALTEINGVDTVGGTPSGTEKLLYPPATLLRVNGSAFIADQNLRSEVFGPLSMVVCCKDLSEMEQVVHHLEGQLTGTVLGDEKELLEYGKVVGALRSKVGRILFNGAPTGVAVNSAMVHGGPFPASTDARFTSVGSTAIQRWVRPVAFQDWPNSALPDALKNDNPLKLRRMENGVYNA